MILAIDFDGTIVQHEYPKVGEPLPGAIEWLRALQQAGAKLILWTMRSGENLQDAVRFLHDNGIEMWAYNENPEQDWTDSPKCHADVYVDDRGLGVPTILDQNGRLCVDWSLVGPRLLGMVLLRAEVGP